MLFSIRTIAASAVACLLVSATPALAALTLTPGMVVNDINFSLNQSASYDGTSQTLTVSVGADRIDLQGGGTVELDPGDLTLEMALQLLGYQSGGLGGYAAASIDILLKDSGNATLFQAVFIDTTLPTGSIGGQVYILEFGGGFGQGSLGGGFLADSLSNPLMAAIATLDGNLSLSLDGILAAFGSIDNFAGGFNDFTSGVTGDLSFVFGTVPNPEFEPIPEPATGLLVGLALAALAMARRRRS